MRPVCLGPTDLLGLGVQVLLYFRTITTMVRITRYPLPLLARSDCHFLGAVRRADLVS
jgi:hypothetical protein